MRPYATLDAHESNPRGVDAAGDVVSAEPLLESRTLLSQLALERGSRRRRGIRAPTGVA